MLTNESIAVLEFISSYYLSGPQNHQYNQEKNSPHRFFSFLFFPIFSTIYTLFFYHKKETCKYTRRLFSRFYLCCFASLIPHIFGKKTSDCDKTPSSFAFFFTSFSYCIQRRTSSLSLSLFVSKYVALSFVHHLHNTPEIFKLLWLQFPSSCFFIRILFFSHCAKASFAIFVFQALKNHGGLETLLFFSIVAFLFQIWPHLSCLDPLFLILSCINLQIRNAQFWN